MNGEQREALFKVLRPDDETVRALKEKVKATQLAPRRRLLPVAVAAALVLIAALGVWLTLRNHQTQPKIEPSDPIVTTAQPPETVPYNADGSVNYTALTSDGAVTPSIVKSGEFSDVTGFREDMIRRCDLCFEGTAIDVQYKHYDFRYYYGEKFDKDAYIREQPVTQLTTFKIEKVWHGDQSLVGSTIMLEDEGGGEDSTFGYRKDVCYVVLVLDLGDWKMWQPDDEEQYLVEGDVERSSPYTTYYPFQPQVEKARNGDYIVPQFWTTMTADSEVKVALSAETPYSGWSRYDYDMYADELRLVKADIFQARMEILASGAETQPDTIPYNPDGSVNFSELAVDGAAWPTVPQSSGLASIVSFSEYAVKGCDLCFEGTVTDIQLKQYDYRYYYGEKFGKEVIVHEQPTTQLTTFRIEKVWHGDPTLVGTTITLEDDTRGLDGRFGYREGVCYVVLMQDLTGWNIDMWHPVGEERLIEGDIKRSSPYATHYPWQPQVEKAKTGDYIVPLSWETVTADCDVRVVFDPETPYFGSVQELEWFSDRLRLVDADTFQTRMAALLAE